MLNFFRVKNRNIKNDVLAGITTSFAMVPETVAFAFVAGVSPLVGLYSSFFMGLVTAVLGGRPGMIAGGAGAMAVVVVALVATRGIAYLFPTVMLCGLIQVLIGLLRYGKFIRMVPNSVMLGFLNGLAIVMFVAQLGSFKALSPTGVMAFLEGTPLLLMLGLVGLTMLIIWLLPKFTKAVPASLVAILVVTGVAAGVNRWGGASMAQPGQRHTVLTVGDFLLNSTRNRALDKARAAIHPPRVIRADETETTEPRPVPLSPEQARSVIESVRPADVGLGGGLPRPFFLDPAYKVLPPFSFATLWIILPFSLTLAGVGLIESLMTLTLIDEMTKTRGRSNRECVAQGAGNIVCGLFGGMGGCAMIGQSMINLASGGRGRLSGVVTAVCILLFILFLSPWIEMIPMAALVGVMFMVVIATFEWASLRMFGKMPRSDLLVMGVVTSYTVIKHDLATAVLVGVVASALVFAWQHAKHVWADATIDEQGAKSYQMHGALFFASVANFKELFQPETDPADVVIDFRFTRVYDQSGLEAINTVAKRYRDAGKALHLRHLSPECRELLGNAKDFVEVNVSQDPHYHVASNRLI